MKFKTYISRIYQFSAAHRLYNPSLNNISNRNIYDKCSNINGHGHDYKLEVTLTGIPDFVTGIIIPLTKFDTIINSVLKQIDYKHLNFQAPHFKKKVSSGEYIVQYLWNEINKSFPKGMLHHLKLWETNNNYFEYGYNFI